MSKRMSRNRLKREELNQDDFDVRRGSEEISPRDINSELRLLQELSGQMDRSGL